MTLGTRFFLVTAAILVVAVAALIVATDRWLRESLEQSLAVEIERQTRLAAATLPRDSASLRDAVRNLGLVVGRRVTVIDSAGRVLADSDFDERSVALLGNHLDRPEVADALSGRLGVAQRVSVSTGRAELKVAVAAWPGVLRISAPVTQIQATVRGAQRAVLFAAVLALAVGGALVIASGRAMARPLNQLAAAARSVAQGGEAGYPASRAPEIRQLVHAFRDMQGQISERIAALEQGQEETRTLLDSMAEGVIAADGRGAIRLCNAPARRILGYAPDDRLPDLRELFHQREAREVVGQVLAGRTVDGVEVAIEGRTVLCTGRPLPEGGGVLGLLDITDLKRLQTVRRDFVANVSHELKTPLTSIFGYAETLLNDRPDPKTAERFTQTIRDNAERMQHLVDDLLDLARLESGGWLPDWKIHALGALTDDAWRTVADRARQRGVTLEEVFSPDLAIHGDARALHEILVNLFDNALRHTSAGGRVTVRGRAASGATEVDVADTGSGIPPEHLSRVFERFYRVDVGRSRAEGGTGLGLAIVKHFVEAHGGTVAIDSRLGHGTTVSLSFPHQPPAA